MSSSPASQFDYSVLSSDSRTKVQLRTSEIKFLMRRTAQDIIDIGKKLIEVKAELGHGNFNDWLKAEFEWSEQTARQFMQVYRWAIDINNQNSVFEQFATSALYLLAAPSTPTQARQQAIKLAYQGEKITYSLAKSIVEQSKIEHLDSSAESIASETIEVVAETVEEMIDANQLLFRLKNNSGSIVHLYNQLELECQENLEIGATVTIKVGRWQGQTATVEAILVDESNVSQAEPTSEAATTRNQKQSHPIKPLLNRRVTGSLSPSASSHLEINYNNLQIVFKGSPKMLSAFVKQIQSNDDFVQDIFQQAFLINQ